MHNLPVAGFTRLKTAHRIFHCNKQNMNEYWNAQSIIQDLQLTFFPFRYRTLPSIRSILRDLLAGRTDNHTKLRSERYAHAEIVRHSFAYCSRSYSPLALVFVTIFLELLSKILSALPEQSLDFFLFRFRKLFFVDDM